MRSRGGVSSIWWTQKGGTGELGIIRTCVDMDVVRIVVVLMRAIPIAKIGQSRLVEMGEHSDREI